MMSISHSSGPHLRKEDDRNASGGEAMSDQRPSREFVTIGTIPSDASFKTKFSRSSACTFSNVGANPSNAHLAGHSLDGKSAPSFNPATAFSSPDPGHRRKSSNKSSTSMKSDTITVPEGDMLTSEQMSKLVQKIGPWAVEWVRNKIQNLDEKSRETQAKQLLRCKFMLLNQFGEGERSKKWQNDLQHVGGEIIRQLCPNWETDLEDRKIFLVIEKAVHNAVFMKRSPRQEWFKPVVYQWLKEGEAKRVAAKTHNIAWYPQHAIQVAHHIFLTKGDEEALVHYFRHKSRYKGEIKKVVDARKKDEDPKDDYRSRLSPEQQKFEAELRALEQRIQQREERVKQRETRLNEREYQVKDREMELKAKENRSRKLEHQLRVWEQKLKVREQRLKKMHTRSRPRSARPQPVPTTTPRTHTKRVLATSERDTKRATDFVRPSDFIRPNDFVSIGERDAKRFNDFSSFDYHDAKKANNFSSIEVRSNDPDSWLREYFRVDSPAEESGSHCPVSLTNIPNSLPSMSSLEDMQPDGPICPYCKEEMNVSETYSYKCQTPLGTQEATYKVYEHLCEAHPRGYAQFSDLKEFWTNTHPDFKHLTPVHGAVEWQKKCVPCAYEGEANPRPDSVYCATIRGRMWTRCGYCNGLHGVDPANKVYYPKHMCPNYQADSLMTSLR